MCIKVSPTGILIQLIKAEINLSVIDCFKMTFDVNKADALTDSLKEIYGNMRCVDFWKTESELSLA